MTEDFPYQFALSFTWHHGLFDGYCVEVIMKDILVELTKYSEDSVNETSASGGSQRAQKREEDSSKETTKIIVKSDESNSLPPPIDEFVKVNASLVNAFAFLCGLWPVKKVLSSLLKFSFQKKNFYTANIEARQMTNTNHIKGVVLAPLVFEKAETDQILKACRKHGVSFTTVLATASVLALYDMVDHFKKGNSLNLSGDIAYSVAASLRMQMKVPDGYHAMYTYRITDRVPLKYRKDFWALTKKAGDITSDKDLSKCKHYLQRLSLQETLWKNELDIFSLGAINLKNMGRISESQIFLTNLGAIDRIVSNQAMQYNHMRATGWLGGSSFHRYGPVFCCLVGTVKKQMLLSIFSYSHICDEEMVIHYARACKQILLDATSL